MSEEIAKVKIVCNAEIKIGERSLQVIRWSDGNEEINIREKFYMYQFATADEIEQFKLLLDKALEFRKAVAFCDA